MRGRIDGEEAYVLHTRPYRESSLIAEVFSRNYGRVPLLARAARRPRSSLRGQLLAFQPMLLGWSGKGEVYTMHKAEWKGGMPLLQGEALFCGYYLNELLLRLLPREDAHPYLFGSYAEILAYLAHTPEGQVSETDLRRFEKRLLQELGYGLSLQTDCSGQPVEADGWYAYEVEQGPIRVAEAGKSKLSVSGRTLLDLASENFSAQRSRQEAKNLMRALLAHYLGDTPLQTRKMFGDAI